MKIKSSIQINNSKEKIWSVITDIKNSCNYISSIIEIKILENHNSLVGLKWSEKRKFLGKEATEIMWITDAVTYKSYKTRAESHGSIYLSTITIIDKNDYCYLEIEFEGLPQTKTAKFMSFIFMPFFKRATIQAFLKDLEDLKKIIEA